MTPYTHAADDHFEYLVDYLRHLADVHGVEETPELWRSGRDTFDVLHAEAHGVGGDDVSRELVVLPALRLARLAEAVEKIVGERAKTHEVMAAVEECIERDAYRWGNACAEKGCGKHLTWDDRGFMCPEHGRLRGMASTILLIGFRPVTLDRTGR